MDATIAAPDFWTEETSVFFTSFWGWSPETWATVGWSNQNGLARRDNLLKQLSDPFIAVCYITKSGNPASLDPSLKGMIAGYYLVSHETGDRDQFTHPIHHQRSPEKWRHSLRALRAFSYLPEYRVRAEVFDPNLAAHARSVAAMGKVVTDPSQIAILRSTPAMEVEIYSPIQTFMSGTERKTNGSGLVKAGPASADGYIVAGGSDMLPRHLYLLQLMGDTDSFLGYSANERFICKVGLSVSPELRRQKFQKTLPDGAYHWSLIRTTAEPDNRVGFSFEAAVTGEDAMKRYMAKAADWLGGEFYLASEAVMDEAWRLGKAAAQSHK